MVMESKRLIFLFLLSTSALFVRSNDGGLIDFCVHALVKCAVDGCGCGRWNDGFGRKWFFCAGIGTLPGGGAGAGMPPIAVSGPLSDLARFTA